MTWRVDLPGEVQKPLGRLALVTRDRIERFTVERLATGDDPRRIGHAPQGNRAEPDS